MKKTVLISWDMGHLNPRKNISSQFNEIIFKNIYKKCLLKEILPKVFWQNFKIILYT